MKMPAQRTILQLAPALFAAGLALLLALWSWGAAANTATLSASPPVARQNTTVTLTGGGFAPGETVSIWITYPDYTVFGVAEVPIDAAGSFSYPYLPDFLGATFTPTGRYTYTAHGQQSGREVYASIEVEVALAPGPTANVALTVDRPSQRQGARFTFSGSGYTPGERVALWLRYPDNAIVDLGSQAADGGGRLALTLSTDGVPVGRYALTARGTQGGGNGIAEFDVLVGDLTAPRGSAQLAVGPSASAQRSEVSFRGSGFEPGETVSIWATRPDHSTAWLGDVRAEAAGDFAALLYLDEQDPAGRYAFSAFGNRSERRATAEYRLAPGGSPPAAH